LEIVNSKFSTDGAIHNKLESDSLFAQYFSTQLKLKGELANL